MVWQSLQQEQKSHTVVQSSVGQGPGPREMALKVTFPQGHRAREGTEKPAYLATPIPSVPGHPLPACLLQHEGPVIAFDPTAMLRLLVFLPGHPLSLSLRKHMGRVTPPPTLTCHSQHTHTHGKGQVNSCRHTARRVRVQAESWQLLRTAAHPSPSPLHHSPEAFQSPCRGDDRARPARRG